MNASERRAVLQAELPKLAPGLAAGGEPDACEPTACPDPMAVVGASWAPAAPYPCCLAGACAIGRADDFGCEPTVSGSSDADCADADLRDLDGGVVPGCCRPDNTCGHFDEELGCHELINHYWHREVRSCDGKPAQLPEGPFMCKPNDSPCTYDWECCGHYNYQTQCSTAFGGDTTFCNTCPEC